MAFSIEQYIRQRAPMYGIDPDIAIRVAKSEGGLKDPIRQSLVTKNGVREPSYGPFQLLIGGGSTGFPAGLGNQALAAGIDPRTPDGAARGIDFALNHAANNGWGAWYGAKNTGIGRWQGIGGSKSAAPGNIPSGLPTLPPGPDGPKGQESYPRAAPDLPPPTTISDRPVASPVDMAAAPSSPPPPGLLSILNGGDGPKGQPSALNSMLAMLAQPQQPQQIAPMPQQAPQGPTLSDFVAQFMQSRKV